MCHTGAFCDQFFIVLFANSSSVTGDCQIVIFSALIRKLNIKTKIRFNGFLEIDLADIITSG